MNSGFPHFPSTIDSGVISLTRLRLSSPRFLPGFFWHTLRSALQARRAPGFRGMRLLADRALTFWTISAWDGPASMKAFRNAGSHRHAMRRLADWCDEASVVRWNAPPETMKDWEQSCMRMKREGKPSPIRNPSAQHQSLGWPEPRLQPLLEIALVPRSKY